MPRKTRGETLRRQPDGMGDEKLRQLRRQLVRRNAEPKTKTKTGAR